MRSATWERGLLGLLSEGSLSSHPFTCCEQSALQTTSWPQVHVCGFHKAISYKSIIVPQGQCSTCSLKMPQMICAGVLQSKGTPYLVAFGHNPWVILSATVNPEQPMLVAALFAFSWSTGIPCWLCWTQSHRVNNLIWDRLTFSLKTRREAPFNGGSKKSGQESGTQQL